MNRISKYSVALIGWGIIAALMYVCLCLTLYVVASYLPRPVQIFPLLRFQSLAYFMGGRNIWQYDPSCAQPDSELIYIPREGACHFTNIEFDTTLHFDSSGRLVPARAYADQSLPGIAVLGDSHAMGWGVEDDETFANVMQTSLQKPVFNLGVSSYGTERELKRLAVSGLADKVDTIVILYIGNDYSENMLLRTPADYQEAAGWFEDEVRLGEGIASYESKAAYLAEILKEVLVSPLAVPLQRLFSKPELQASSGPDFSPHLEALRDTLLRYQSLLVGKQVYIAYVMEGGGRFSNYPAGRHAMVPAVTFLEPALQAEDFFRIDDHMSATGHRHLGEWLAATLNEQLVQQP